MPQSNSFAREASSGDLSNEISQFVEKQPGDYIRCTLVCNDNYRCNWWAPGNTAGYDNPSMYGLIVTTHVVRKSQFLTVSKVGERLVIRQHSRAGTGGVRERVKG